VSQLLSAPIAQYLAGLTPADPLIDELGRTGRARDLPLVDEPTGALLEVLVRASRATRVLEIGTAIGYSGLWLARGLPSDGTLITMEIDADRAAEAREHFRRAGLGTRASVIVGDAARMLHKFAGPFDLIFNDGDKRQYEPLLEGLVALLAPGGLLVTDDVLWGGDVAPDPDDAPPGDPEKVRLVASYNRRLAADPRLRTVILPVGDGVSVSVKM
jgi:predicted O-methyltransferase YrrM